MKICAYVQEVKESNKETKKYHEEIFKKGLQF